ncbi:MAG: hypothetical protein EBT47_05615 [Chloroflexi bacterium]|nr:hypothetical protein [Chloroflexota bacterium]
MAGVIPGELPGISLSERAPYRAGQTDRQRAQGNIVNDVQSRPDERQVDVQRVGIKRVELPWRVQERSGGVQTVTAMTRLSVDLPAEYKGTHMSRLVEMLEVWKDEPLSPATVAGLLSATQVRLGAVRAHVGLTFTYFMTKAAPVSQQRSTMGYTCQVDATVDGDQLDLVIGADVPITTVCPCSKEISVAGAHNQRAWLRLRVRPTADSTLTFEDLIRHGETGYAPTRRFGGSRWSARRTKASTCTMPTPTSRNRKGQLVRGQSRLPQCLACRS